MLGAFFSIFAIQSKLGASLRKFFQLSIKPVSKFRKDVIPSSFHIPFPGLTYLNFLDKPLYNGEF
jgi:hypothetical protein